MWQVDGYRMSRKKSKALAEKEILSNGIRVDGKTEPHYTKTSVKALLVQMLEIGELN